MENSYLLLTTFLMVLAAVGFTTAVIIYRRRVSAVLGAYIVFLTGWHLVGLTTVLGVVLGPVFFSPPASNRMILLMVLVGMPLWVLMLYAFTTCCTLVNGHSPSRTTAAAFTTAGVVGLAGVLAHHAGLLILTRTELPGTPLPVPGLVSGAVVIFGLVRVVRHRHHRPQAERVPIRDFTWTASLGYLFAELAKLAGSGVQDGITGHLVTGLVYFASPLPMLWPLDRLARVRRKMAALRPEHAPDADRLAAAWGVTPRESEIVALVLQGLRNREIQDSMGISLDTVKKHIFNIYRKTGVSSRVELVNLVRSLDDQHPG